MPPGSIETFGGKRLLDSVIRQIEFAENNALITKRQMRLLKQPLLRVQEEVLENRPETPEDWSELVAFLEEEEGQSFWEHPVKQPESLFPDGPPEVLVLRSEIAKFIRTKAGHYIRQEDTRKAFIRQHRLNLECNGHVGKGSTGQSWDHLLDALFLLILMQVHRRRLIQEAGVALRAIYDLAEAMRKSPPRVPIRKQELKVQDIVTLRTDRPVVGQVSMVLVKPKLVYLQIGWRRPALVRVPEWTEGLRALRRGDRCLMWVTGIQNDKVGHQLVIGTFEPPGHASVSLDLPRSLLRHRPGQWAKQQQQQQPGDTVRQSTPPSRIILPSVLPLGSPSPLETSPTRPHSTGGPSTRPSYDATHGQRPGTAAASIPRAEGPAPSEPPGPRPIRSIVDELKWGQEFRDILWRDPPPGSPPLPLGLAALGKRLDLQQASITTEEQGGSVTLTGPLDSVLEALDRILRVATRWAVSARDPVVLSGLGIHYLSDPKGIALPPLKACGVCPRSGPFGHPYHALEEECWPLRFVLCPVHDDGDEDGHDGVGGDVSSRYVIAAESAEVAEAGINIAFRLAREEQEERRKTEAAPIVFSPSLRRPAS